MSRMVSMKLVAVHRPTTAPTQSSDPVRTVSTSLIGSRRVSATFGGSRRSTFMPVVTARGESADIVSRVFVPYLGIDEDPVTGSAHAALAPYWAERLDRNEFTALQASERTGVLHCRLEGERVLLGGECHTVIVGQFQL